ncbi:MAG: hypothetical protein QOE33_1289 [Acidobacteriota bacterium]|nr:hypothetical protein [Acidobacteriota bacterium]
MLFVLVLGATGIHTTRTIRRALYWREHRDEPISGWMTVGYVAHSYHVPAHVLYSALDLPQTKPHDRRPLREIARAQGRSMNDLRAILQDAITHARPPYAPPPPPDDGGKP